MNDFSSGLHLVCAVVPRQIAVRIEPGDQAPLALHHRSRPMPRILIVEDQKKLLASLHRGLAEEGYEVISAATGEDGYYQATTADVDLVLLDVMLPKRNGFQVLDDLRQ